MREQFEEWFKSTKSYRMLMEMSYFKKDLFHFIDGRSEYCHSSVQIAFMTWQARQAEIDHLSSVLEERTKEWLKAIELGDYFKNVAKPLRAEIDQLQSQINDMAEVGLNQEKALMVKNKQIELVKEVLQGLKDELGYLVEMDLYDKGYRVCSKYVIDDLEQALGGAQ